MCVCVGVGVGGGGGRGVPGCERMQLFQASHKVHGVYLRGWVKYGVQ